VKTMPLWDTPTLSHIAQEKKWVLHAYDAIDSTNTALLTQARNHSIHRHWAISRVQHSGKGRQGKAWHSHPNEALLMSFGWIFNRPISWVAQGASLVIGQALAHTLHQFLDKLGYTTTSSLPAALRLKWPNDILLNGKKLAGILIETAHHTAQHSCVVIGIGLNWKSPSEETAPDSIGLETVCPSAPSGSAHLFLSCLLEQLDKDLYQFGEDGFAPFRYDWNLLHVWPEGTPVCWYDSAGQHFGHIEHVDTFGQLWIIDQSGSRLALGHEAYSLRLRKE
jgi:BirA family transcriptional regulator, biotin operon repressor / biotin---[acetyl-CoA-carboxylase] ligase